MASSPAALPRPAACWQASTSAAARLPLLQHAIFRCTGSHHLLLLLLPNKLHLLKTLRFQHQRHARGQAAARYCCTAAAPDKIACQHPLKGSVPSDSCSLVSGAPRRMTGGGEKATKRPLEGNETKQVSDSSDQKGKLGELLQQIEYFEQLGEEEEQPRQPDSKKPSKLHSLTQNTTHRKIRCGGRADSTAVGCPGCLSAPLPPPPPPRGVAANHNAHCLHALQGGVRVPGCAAAAAASPCPQEVRRPPAG